ncbi:MAG: ABC transporter permease, partial [Acidobacteriota bacterium]|nr:ABC transporter permease [Acidobacteriota bacterium]
LWVNPQQVLPELSVGSTADVRTIRNSHWLAMVARLKPGVTVAQAQGDMEAIARRIGQQHNSNHGVRVVSLHERTIGNVRPLLLLLLGAVGLVLLVACANVANLLLARHATRYKEIAVRTALGASRWRVVRQLLTESMLLACLGGAVGLALAAWGVDLLKSALPAGTPRLNEIGLDASMLGVTLAVSLVTGLVFGVLPALRASDLKLSESLKEGARGTTEDFRRNRVRGLLVISEVALSLLVLIGASLLVKSFLHLQRVEPGFDPANLLTMQVSLPASKYAQPAQQTAFFRQLTQRLETLPGVRAIAVANDLPIDGDTQTSTPHIEGRPAVAGEQPLAGVHTVSPAYLQTMGIALLKGREFTPADADESPPVIVINETMARRLFPNEDPLGKRIKFSDPSTDEPWKEVVGIVGDVKHNGLDAEPYMETYVPFLQSPRAGMSIAVRTTSEPASLTAAVRQAVLEIDKDQPIYSVRTMEQILSESVASRRLSMTLFSLLAGLALLLATVGIYGVIAYTVSSRTHEIGVRVALGAQTGDVLRLILKQGLVLILSGVTVGILTAFLLSRVLASLIFEVSATDPATFVVVPLLLVAVALLACYIPARRATRVDPMVALRYE